MNLVNSQLKVFVPMRKQVSKVGLSLGKRYGIQFGGLSVDSEFFPAEIRGKQSLDSLIVAHGMTRFQSATNWTQQDVDTILCLGSELYQATKAIQLEKLIEFTKGFTFKKKLVQVSVSEPKVIGKIMTLTDRSVDLRLGLEKFFSQYGHGILQTPSLDLYIVHEKIFYVFDPRGRTIEAVRCQGGEASLMAFVSLHNVYHLIINLSGVSARDPFKISHVTVSNVMTGSPEKFTASCGNPSKKLRSVDFKPFDHQISYLRGSIHLGSSVFGNCAGRQYLTTAIMAMVYAKIDPPNSWEVEVFDRVFHFGAKLFRDVIGKKPVKNLAIGEIPSKFYVGDFYRAGIAIVPFLKQPELLTTHLICDNPLKKAFDELLEQTTFRMFLLQIENFTFAVWKMKSSELFFFFDGCQKDVEGETDRFEGSSHLFLVKRLENVCELVVNRLIRIQTAGKKLLNVHGMKIFELTKLTKEEQIHKPRFKVLQTECIKPMNAEAGQEFKDSPSIVDSVVPLITASQVLKLREKLPQKPAHRKAADLNSPSLVCCKERRYEEIMSSVEKKPSVVIKKEFPKTTINMASVVNEQDFQEFLKKKPEKARKSPKNSDPCKFPSKCRSFVECCDNVVLKIDSRSLQQQQLDADKAESTDEKTEAVQSPEIALSATSSKSKVWSAF